MTKRDDYLMDYTDVQQISRKFFKSLGLADQSEEQINNFISAKILEYKGGRVRFRYRAFLEYFIAERMRDDDDFKNWVLDDERYLSFGNEIEYFAGIKRKDLDLLELIGARFNSLGEILENETGWVKHLNTINELTPPHDEVKTAFFEGIERQLDAFNNRQWEEIKSLLADDSVFHRANATEVYSGPGAIVDHFEQPTGGEWNVKFARLDSSDQFTGSDGRVVERGDFAITAGADDSACYTGSYMMTWAPRMAATTGSCRSSPGWTSRPGSRTASNRVHQLPGRNFACAHPSHPIVTTSVDC
jgi:hypothetical protein